MAEQFGFKKIIGDCRAVHGDKRLVRAIGLAVHVTRNDFLTGTAFTRDQDRSRTVGDLICQSQGFRHAGIAMDQGVAFLGHCFEDCSNQIRFGRQGNEFLCARFDGVNRTIDIITDAAGHNRHCDALGTHCVDQGGDIKRDVSHDQINPVARSQDVKRGRHAFGQLDRSAARHCDLAGCAYLSAQSTNDQYLHRLISFRSVWGPFAPGVSG